MLGLPLCAQLSDLEHHCIYQVLPIVSHHCFSPLGSSGLRSSSGEKEGKTQPSGSKSKDSCRLL